LVFATAVKVADTLVPPSVVALLVCIICATAAARGVGAILNISTSMSSPTPSRESSDCRVIIVTSPILVVSEVFAPFRDDRAVSVCWPLPRFSTRHYGREQYD
jgi:hypothetical protein